MGGTALLLLALRRVRDVAITMAPIVLTGLLTMGSCVLIGQPLNFANIIALPLMFAVAEAYPELKANENFRMLQEELSGTESKIAYARQFYNDNVMSYNTLIQSFPANMIANMGGFMAKDYFEIEEEAARGPVQVKF